MNEPFYIGYLPKAPRPVARFVIWICSVGILMAIGMSIFLTSSQNEPADSEYEFGTFRSFSGLLTAAPYPSLLIPGEGEYLLVAPFKHGADSLVRGSIGRFASVRGTLIRRNGISMIELAGPDAVDHSLDDLLPHIPDSMTPRDPPHTSSLVGDSEGIVVRLSGEIVDSKCWLGVMNPASGVVHRACARLCIRGGIPPLFVYKDENGHTAVALLTDINGSAVNERILRYVTRHVTIEGVLTKRNGDKLPRLRVEPDSIVPGLP